MSVVTSYDTDVLVIGAGLAGLRAADEAARAGARVLVVSKDAAAASREIMGFNAAVRPEDSEETYFQDVLRSGCGLNRREVVRTLVSEAGRMAPYLEGLGMVFDRCEDGTYHAQFPLGCTVPRLIHQRSLTGKSAMELVGRSCRDRGVDFLTGVQVAELLTADGAVCGAAGFHLAAGGLCVITAGAVVLATGGSGALHPVSTYPRSMVGEGYGLALRAGAELVDMEFLQFEPCCFVYPEALRGGVLPTTLLKAGARLTNAKGDGVLEKHGLRLEDLQKGELSRAMRAELAAGLGGVHGGLFFDVTTLPRDLVTVGHSIFYAPALAAGIDITAEKAEVAPAAHTTLGGVRIDGACASSLPGLFAAGEVSGGVHGANRLGGCAGAEVLTLGGTAGRSAARHAAAHSHGERPVAFEADWERRCEARLGRDGSREVSALHLELAERLADCTGLIRDGRSLDEGRQALRDLTRRLERCQASDAAGLASLFQLENMLLTARMQVESSLLRAESRGVFYRKDYPRQSDEWERNIIARKSGASVSLCVEPCQ